MSIRKAAVFAALAAALFTTACVGSPNPSSWDKDIGTSSSATGGPNDPDVRAQSVGNTGAR
jgi:hypothetical protein